MHPSKTAPLSSRTTFSAVLAITFCAPLMPACAPGEIASSGGETFGSETAGDGDGDPASSNDELPMPGDEVVCEGMAARAEVSGVECPDSSPCTGTWDPCGFDSAAVPASYIQTLMPVGHEGLWPCAEEIDVDACVEVGGHKGCFWYAGDYAVAVAPVCAVESLPGWHHVGSGMMAREA